MTDDELLDRLSELCGILREYRDIWGRPRPVERDVVRALLAAMGLRVETPAEIRDEIRARDEAPWRRALPPVLVARAGGPIVVPVGSPEAKLGERLRVVLETEDSRRVEQGFIPRDCAETGRRSIDGTAYSRRALALEARPALGYHRLTLLAGDGSALGSMRLIVAPDRCFVPAALEDAGRVWGPAVQLYAVRSGRDWGAGDFGDLDRLVRACGSLGAGIVGLNPLH
ncbi:MAG TPA: hypothetical protein VD788_17060, partial [Candidatus Polarisedimenticolaceae bacterium]|nr:hypothetical protein [Candidatus Polarisedimenticolaceae bacterium]